MTAQTSRSPISFARACLSDSFADVSTRQEGLSESDLVMTKWNDDSDIPVQFGLSGTGETAARDYFLEDNPFQYIQGPRPRG